MAPTLRRSRATMAAFIVAGTAAFGVGAISAVAAAPTAYAADQTCLLPPGPPAGKITAVKPTETGGQIEVTWTVDPNCSIKDRTVTVNWAPPPLSPPPGAPQPATTSATNDTGTCITSPTDAAKQVCTFPWPADLLVNGYLLNGTYQIAAAANQCNTALTVPCSTSLGAAPPQTAAVALPATAPTNVTAVLAANQKDTIVTWDPNPNPEPDLLGYRVYRVSGSQATEFYECRPTTSPPQPNIPVCPAKLTATDTAPGGGRFTYKVVAFRYGATYANAPVEAASLLSKSVTVPGPAAPPTTVRGGTGAGTSSGLPSFGAISTKPTKPGTVTGTPGPAISVPGTPDPGFQATLPYKGTTAPPPSDPAVVGQPPAPSTPKTKASVGSIALIGAGLLVAVIAFHGLWLRSEVKRGGGLEVLEPEA